MKWSKIALGLVLAALLVLVPTGLSIRDNDVSASSSSGKSFETYTDYQFLDGQYVLKTINPDGSVEFENLGPALRRESGPGSMEFHKNETVFASKIVLFSGKTYLNALIFNSPEGGILTEGVVNPFPQEIAGRLPTDLEHPRKETGTGGAQAFEIGDRVVGFRIHLADGRERQNGVFIRFATQPGLVYDGVVNPLDSELTGASEWTQ